MRVMRCRHGRCRWSWRKQYEYKTGKKRSEKYSESIPVKGCTWRVRDTADQAETDALNRTAGVGKTQIMEQIARECKIGLVAYTITHHTRQSAVGLPFIKEREYDGKSYSVTEYTMSEIIASVYERMEATGLKEGILFIDEINCVSETLAPTMLQFLQCKTFGNQAVPKGWVIVAAGIRLSTINQCAILIWLRSTVSDIYR